MSHKNEKGMMFYFLQTVNYNQTWEQIESDIGYDLGDYRFKNQETYGKICRLVKQNWLELKDYFNEEGN